MASFSEHRTFTRVPFDADAKLYSSNGAWDTQLIDISLSGVRCDRPTDWQAKPGKGYRLDLRLPGGIRISMNATAANNDARRIGFRWSKIDFDSFVQLKRLIELNLGDPERLGRELSGLDHTAFHNG